MKKLIGEYAYPIVIILGFCVLIVISWFYSILDMKDANINMNTFWSSVLSSAFVDIISLVLSTILITTIIERKKKFVKKKDLFLIVREDHIKLAHIMKARYKNMMLVKSGDNVTSVFNQNDFDFKKVKDYLKIIEDKDFQKHIIHRIMNKREKDEQNLMTVSFVKEEIIRLELFVEYVDDVNKFISNYIREFGVFFSEEYLTLLINIKKSLNKNPFEINDTFGTIPIILEDFEPFIEKNEEYINTVLEFEEYFNDFSEKINNEKNEWGIITLGVSAIFIAFLLIKVGLFLVAL